MASTHSRSAQGLVWSGYWDACSQQASIQPLAPPMSSFEGENVHLLPVTISGGIQNDRHHRLRSLLPTRKHLPPLPRAYIGNTNLLHDCRCISLFGQRATRPLRCHNYGRIARLEQLSHLFSLSSACICDQIPLATDMLHALWAANHAV